jgi:hypothetical protein
MGQIKQMLRCLADDIKCGTQGSKASLAKWTVNALPCSLHCRVSAQDNNIYDCHTVNP